MSDCKKEWLSFWGLLSQHRIEIPVIQRDYAQGRSDIQAQTVREQIVKDVFDVLIRPDKKLVFDFVYGRVSNAAFVPIDGQQRLTTLFLLHLYLLKRAERCETCADSMLAEIKDKLKGFTYATRKSSREFCEEIVKNEIILPPRDEKTKPADFIKDQAWFFADWEHDPTISGMLRTLDEIHSQFNNRSSAQPYDPCLFLGRLTSRNACPIGFYFLNMDSGNLDDDLYLKMNARGLPLTVFESFKANLEKFLCDAGRDESVRNVGKEIKRKIDREWLDFFWAVKNDNLSDNLLMMSCFSRCLVVFKIVAKSATQTNEFLETIASLEASRTLDSLIGIKGSESFLDFKLFEEVLRLDGVIPLLEKAFDTLSLEGNHKFFEQGLCPNWERGAASDGNDTHTQLRELFANFKNGDAFKEYACFYAILRFLCYSQDADEFSRWIRIQWNLIQNSDVTRKSTFISYVRFVDIFASNIENRKCGVYQYLAEFEAVDPSGFASEQLKEEVLKARIILWGGELSPDAEKMIIATERHRLFKGRIDFLLMGQTPNECIDNLNSFWPVFQQFFPDGGSSDLYITMSARLLTFGDYSCSKNNNKQFANSESTWYELFHSHNGAAKGFFERLLRSSSDSQAINSDLAARPPYDWRWYFVKYWDAFIKDGTGAYRWDWDEKGVKIWKYYTPTLRGTHCNPYLLAVYKLLKEGTFASEIRDEGLFGSSRAGGGLDRKWCPFDGVCVDIENGLIGVSVGTGAPVFPTQDEGDMVCWCFKKLEEIYKSKKERTV